MQYCIDYRNGGMGNTVLAHILYSCNQVDLDLDTFFSDVADAHLINKYNDTALTSMHLDERTIVTNV